VVKEVDAVKGGDVEADVEAREEEEAGGVEIMLQVEEGANHLVLGRRGKREGELCSRERSKASPRMRPDTSLIRWRNSKGGGHPGRSRARQR